MYRPRFITPNVLFENPGLINSVKNNPPEIVDKMKEQLKHLRRYYRLLRDDQGLPTQNIVPTMIDHFPKKVTTLIKLAAYIETNVVYVPHNQIPRWVTVPFEAIYSLVQHALTTTGDQRSAMRLVTAYLWYKFSQGAPITPLEDVIKSSGLSKNGFVEDLRTQFGVEMNYSRYSVKFGTEFRTSRTIQWNPSLPCTGIYYEQVLKYKSRTTVSNPPAVPDELLKAFVRHQLFFPTRPFQKVDKECPLILSDGLNATVPLVAGIVPIILSRVINKHALHEWIKAGGVQMPSKKMKTLYSYAKKGLDGLQGTVNYINLAHVKFKLAPRLYLGDFWRAQDTIMQRGLLVDIKKLRRLQPPKNPNRSVNWNTKHRKDLNKIKQSIIAAANQTGGIYRGIYHLTSYSERIYYRQNPLQSFPDCFKDAVVASSEYQLVYIDITANDLSILINLAKDKKGLSLLNNGQDPYAYLAKQAFPEKKPEETRRKMVKAVINPWIYGASDETILSNTVLGNKEDIQTVRHTIKQKFPDIVTWINRLEESVQSEEKIPAIYNQIDNTDVPMPRKFGRRIAPSFIIQRTGATILKHAITRITDIPFSQADIILTVHDSILMQALDRTKALPEVDAIAAITHGIQQTPAIETLIAKVGRGHTWKEAETTSEFIICRY